MLGIEVRNPLESLATVCPSKQAKSKSPTSMLFRSTKGASKQRRDLINTEIGHLRDLLPLPESARQRLSQLQIMSLACVFIRKCNYFARLFGNPPLNSETPFQFAQSMSGFLMSSTREGKLLYVSENVTDYLGHSMVDMLTQGDSLYDIIDKRDHAAVQAQLLQSSSSSPSGVSEERTFFCRMNVSRSFRRQAGFGDHKVMHVRGHFVTPMISDQFGNQPVFTAICSPLVTPDVKETVIQHNTMIFQSVHGLDMKYMEMAHNGEHHLGYSDGELRGRSWYELLHPEDLAEAKDKHVQLIKSSHEMGCMLTVRLMSKFGQWVWVNIVMHIRQPFLCDNGDPAIVCINHVIEESEAAGFKLQSQLYSSHIARSPEIFSSPPSGSPPHTITQVASSERSSGGRGYQASEEAPPAYHGEFQVSVMPVGGQQQADMMAGGQQQQQQQQQQQAAGGATLSEAGGEQKTTMRADVLSRLKRKMSESSTSQCKPTKVAKVPPTSRGSPQNLLYSSTMSVAEPAPAPEGGLLDEMFSVQGPGPVMEAPPVYVQLKKEPLLNPKEQLLYPLDLHHPPTPLTPGSISDASTCEDFTSSLCVDVNDAAVVPASLLTPDSSPVCSPNRGGAVELPDIMADLETSFFADRKGQTFVKVKEEPREKKGLPELDIFDLELYLPKTEEEVKKEDEEVVEDDLLGMCESQLAESFISMVQHVMEPDPVLDSLAEPEEETSVLSPEQSDLLEELNTLNQLAANSKPSYGDKDLAGAFF